MRPVARTCSRRWKANFLPLIGSCVVNALGFTWLLKAFPFNSRQDNSIFWLLRHTLFLLDLGLVIETFCVYTCYTDIRNYHITTSIQYVFSAAF